MLPQQRFRMQQPDQLQRMQQPDQQQQQQMRMQMQQQMQMQQHIRQQRGVSSYEPPQQIVGRAPHPGSPGIVRELL